MTIHSIQKSHHPRFQGTYLAFFPAEKEERLHTGSVLQADRLERNGIHMDVRQDAGEDQSSIEWFRDRLKPVMRKYPGVISVSAFEADGFLRLEQGRDKEIVAHSKQNYPDSSWDARCTIISTPNNWQVEQAVEHALTADRPNEKAGRGIVLHRIGDQVLSMFSQAREWVRNQKPGLNNSQMANLPLRRSA